MAAPHHGCCLVVCLAIFTKVNALSIPHCERSYTGSVISYIAQTQDDTGIRYLGDATSTADCAQRCSSSLNYVCDASTKNRNNFVYNEDGKATFTYNNPSCELDIDEPNAPLPTYGSLILLTPNFVANEYILDLNLTILSKNEAGLMFKASWGTTPNYWIMVNQAQGKLNFGDFQQNEWTAYGFATASISYGIEYNLRVHIMADGLWSIYFDGVLKWTSSQNQAISQSAHPMNHAGVYTYGGQVRAHSLKVSFPSSADETLCAAYVFNKDTNTCHGYFNVSNYSALNSSLTSNASYDSGIIDYTGYLCTATTAAPTTTLPTTALPTTALPTTTTSTTTASPTTTSATASTVGVTDAAENQTTNTIIAIASSFGAVVILLWGLCLIIVYKHLKSKQDKWKTVVVVEPGSGVQPASEPDFGARQDAMEVTSEGPAVGFGMHANYNRGSEGNRNGGSSAEMYEKTHATHHTATANGTTTGGNTEGNEDV